ncbi:MAG TPA: alpha/beta fold hydrolase [Candidatus Acidoferrum sp.]
MPFVENLGARIHWDEEGSGAPILLIMGLGWASYAWYRSRPVLSEKYRTIALDNRGVGKSDAPPGPYSIAQMAADAAAVLNAARVNTAHIFGVSMGGMIAQEFALQYPNKVRSLILGCTAPGGPQAVRAEQEALQVLMTRGQDPEAFAKAIGPFIYDGGTSPARIEQDTAVRRKWYPPADAYFAQLQAIMAWEAYSRLAQIPAPTLVIHGENDRLVPPENGKLIARRIPGAKLVVIPRASHIFTTDQPEVAHRAILEFLDGQATRKRERTAPVPGNTLA